MKKPIRFGKYYLLERINVGGMAEVFRAKAYGVEGFERLVAVKRILPNIAEDKDFIRMFIDEAKIAVQLNHANIAQIFDLGVVDRDYYIALEHVHGRDLRAIFDRCRHRVGKGGDPGAEPMPIAQACFILMKVCEGLDYAHNKRDQSGRELTLVHRDVSPQNVLVSFEGEVKLIDFGIAKAAGKGSKTQAGILKGKFGYMSPEQVRGLPVDRRSDVFACGIVLYELLTGERLFVGESDFSTLEKVRNVEILPPSTYNRRVGDELERIVLKALAKDTEERYQTAIDLHDELQAFVYTSGEFYSRKDLATWMKTTFAAEIEVESAKLDGYRDMTAPDVRGEIDTAPDLRAEHVTPLPGLRRTIPQPLSHGRRRDTLEMQRMVPPPPRSPLSPPVSPASPGNGRRSAPLPAQVVTAGPDAGTAVAERIPRVGAHEPVEWDEVDDLETSIYADADEVESGDPESPAGPAAAPSAALVEALEAPPAAVAANHETPDLSNLAATARPWPPRSSAPRTRNGGHPGSVFADGSGGPAPRSTSPHQVVRLDSSPPPAPTPRPAEVPVPVVELADLAGSRPQSMFDDPRSETPAFGASFLRAHGHGRWRWIRRLKVRLDLRPSRVAQMVATALVGVLLAVVVYELTDGDRPSRTRGDGRTAAGVRRAPAPPPGRGALAGTSSGKAPPVSPAAAGATPMQVSVDPASGFDLIVDPAGVVVKLDGRSIGKAPLQIRNLVDGNHLVEVEGPPGFSSKSHTVLVTRGQSQRVLLRLDAMPVVGRFVSSPPGARVVLLMDGEKRPLGNAPVEVSLDRRKYYEVVFRRPGFAPATRPVVMTGAPKVEVVAIMERAYGGRAFPAAGRKSPVAGTLLPDVERRAELGHGILGLMATPPCRIFIDGRDTGKDTPQAGIKLRAGRHRVTLINNEFGLRETFVVEIQPGETMNAVKDLTDRLPVE